jgi:hypothetical protein
VGKGVETALIEEMGAESDSMSGLNFMNENTKDSSDQSWVCGSHQKLCSALVL